MDWDLLLILLPALAAGILVISTHVLFGKQVLTRGIIFIDLAVAQIAALGAVLAKTQHDIENLPFSHIWLPAVFALSGAALIAYLAKRFSDELEAIIGCLYVLSAVSAMLILSGDPHGAELLKQLMSGQILWVNWQQLLLPTIIYVLILSLVFLKPAIMQGSSFYLLFAIVITLSVELVGVYLVFSTLILPALAVNRIRHNTMILAYGIGLISYISGLWLSASLDLPSGAVIVVSLAAVSVLFRFCSSLTKKASVDN